VATGDFTGGDVARIADGLAGEGVPCIQVRANAAAAQLRCGGPAGTVDLVVGPDGDVGYADIDPVAGTPSTLYRLLDASFLALWPQDRGDVDDLVAEAVAEPDRDLTGSIILPREEEDEYPVRSTVTGSATWTLRSHYGGELFGLHIRTDALTDRSWPFGAEHYATTLAAAYAVLTPEGFDCGSYGGTGCWRPADQLRVDFEVHGDQVVTVSLTLPTDGASAEPSPGWLPAGLAFLTPQVRGPVGDRIEECRRTGRDFAGVVAGTPLEVEVEVYAGQLAVDIGAPLLYVE